MTLPVTAPPIVVAQTSGSEQPRVELRGISKHFGPTAALADVSMDLRGREIHALVGENGAGKSTLVKILAGVHPPDTGTILLDGIPTQIVDPTAARMHRVAVVHQEPRLFPDLSVAENVFLANPPKGRLGAISWREMRRAAAALFQQLDVRLDVGAPVRGLSMADQQLIEIAKALSMDARVLILDEPTASLSAHEVERLFTIVRRTRDSGVAILFVSHRLDEVFRLSDRATVLRDGRHVITAVTRDLATADLVRYMVGRAVTLFPKGEAAIGETLLEVEGLTRAGEFREVSFSVRAGEILGLAGLVGAGRTEIARVLFGISRPTAGEVRLDGRPVISPPRRPRSGPGSPMSPRTAIRMAWCWTSRSQTTSRYRFWRASSLAFSCDGRPNALSHRATRSASGSGRRASTSLSRRSRGATSRRWSSPSGWPRSPVS